ncbi:MAG: hypothetical protein ACXWIF_17090 [Pyrinomonadaceae bacterium]
MNLFNDKTKGPQAGKIVGVFIPNKQDAAVGYKESINGICVISMLP